MRFTSILESRPIQRAIDAAAAFIRCRRGAVQVELALLAPVIIALAVGAIDLGSALQETARLSSAARAGALYGTRDPANTTNSTAIIQAVRTDAGDTTNQLTVTATRACKCSGGGAVDCGSTCSGDPPRMYLTVKVQTVYASMIPYPFVPDNWTLTRTVSLRAQ